MHAFINHKQHLKLQALLRRYCIGTGADPRYIEVAIRRWQKRTGKDAVQAVSGELFDTYVERRCTDRMPPERDASKILTGADGSVNNEREGHGNG